MTYIVHLEARLDRIVDWVHVGHFDPTEAPLVWLDIWLGWLVNWLCVYCLLLTPTVPGVYLEIWFSRLAGILCDYMW